MTDHSKQQNYHVELIYVQIIKQNGEQKIFAENNYHKYIHILIDKRNQYKLFM